MPITRSLRASIGMCRAILASLTSLRPLKALVAFLAQRARDGDVIAAIRGYGRDRERDRERERGREPRPRARARAGHAFAFTSDGGNVRACLLTSFLCYCAGKTLTTLVYVPKRLLALGSRIAEAYAITSSVPAASSTYSPRTSKMIRTTQDERFRRPNILSRSISAIAGTLHDHRLWLDAALLGIATIILIGLSSVAYWSFYYYYIPQVSLQRDVHLQFGEGHPYGLVELGPELTSFQDYDVSLDLNVPRTPSNLEAGNFMVDLVIYSKAGHQALEDSDNSSGEVVDLTPHRLARSRRTAILTYASRLVDTANRLMQMPFFLLGFRVEDEKLTVNLMSGVQFSRGKSHMPGMLRVELQSDHRLQVYGAAVRFDAKFRGLRWLMYRWKILSFIIFSGTFWTTSMIVACGTWIALTSGKPFAGEAETLSDESSSSSVKKEDDSNGAVQKSEASDTRFIKPESEDEGSYSFSGLAAIPEFPREAKEAEEAEERRLREEKGKDRILAAEEDNKGEDEEETKGIQEDEREASDGDANVPRDTPEDSTGGTESKDEYTDDDMVKIEESTLIQPLSPDSDAFGATTSRHDEKGTPGEDSSALQRRRTRPVEESAPGETEKEEIAS